MSRPRLRPARRRPARPRFPGLLGLALWATLPQPISAQDIEITDCIVRPKETARLGAAARGVIAAIHVDRADRVAEGQVVAELEASFEESEIALARLRFGNDVAARSARARAETAEANAERLGQLVDKNLVKLAEREQALLEARIARLEEEQAVLDARIAGVQLAAAEAALERKHIRAPFDGVVIERLMSVGELYSEQGPVLVVAMIDPLLVEAWLPAAARGRVQPRAAWPLRLEDGTETEAVVDTADPILDPATGTFALRLILPNPDGAILAGQNCRLSAP